MANNLNDHGTVLVEKSDDRLAKVEEAKRTGAAFESVGSNGVEIVKRNGLVEATREVSNSDSSDEDQPLPDYLVQLKESVDDEAALNRQKAQEHSEVSAEIARAQEQENVQAIANLRKDPKYYVKRIQAQQLEAAQRYSDEQNEIAREQGEAEANASVERVKATLADLNDPRPVSSLARRALDKPTDISESATREALETKDRIIYGEDSFADHAVQPRKRSAKKG